jgi:predicted transcriptional regulator
MKFATQFQAEIDRLELTQAQAASILEVSPRAVWKWLHGHEPLALTAEGVLARLKSRKSPQRKKLAT